MRRNKYFLSIIVLLVMLIGIRPCVLAQPNSSSSSNSKKSYPPGNAWTLETPLGMHEASTIDTLLYNYQRTFIPTMSSDAWATTGQLGGPGLNMLYFDRAKRLPFFFNNAVELWIPSYDKTKFYNVYIPMTLLSYAFSYGRENRSDLLRAQFAGNVNRKIGIGAWVDYPYTKGSYTDQAMKELGFGVSGYYNGDHYSMQAFYNNYRHLNKENGGITDPLYVIKPAEVQGGVNDIEPKSIPVRLSQVHNLIRGHEAFMSHSYAVGFHKDISQPNDTIVRTEFVPVTKFTYSFDWQWNSRRFMAKDRNSAASFWEHTYLNPNETDETDRQMSIANTFGVEMVEGFHKWAPFGLAAWVTYEYINNKFRLNSLDSLSTMTPEILEEKGLTPLPSRLLTHDNRNRLWVGARIAKTHGKIIRYNAEGKFGLSGDAAGDIDAKGNITARFRMGKDTVEVAANILFKNEEPDWYLQHYVGNHFVWNNNFGKIRQLRVGGHLYIPWTKTTLGVNFENIQNMVYFNSESLPRQHGGSVQIFSAYIDQKLKFGIWNWNNTITYQTSSNKEILPLPVLTVYSNMFLHFKIAKVLTVQLGIDCDYYTKYPGMDYQPATMSFHVQGENPQYVGNFAFCNAYLTCKLSKVRFFVLCSHVNQNWFGREYFSMPLYPVNPRQFRFGLSIDFAN